MNKPKCGKCDSPIAFGKHTGERRFWDNQWEFYSCGGQKFTSANDWSNPKYTCGDCNNNPDTGLPVGTSCR